MTFLNLCGIKYVHDGDGKYESKTYKDLLERICCVENSSNKISLLKQN